MSANAHRLGWIGMGRMGHPMAERLLKAGHDLSIWNRTRAKAEPLAAKGATLVDRPADLADVDVLFTMVSAGKDLEQVYFGDEGVVAGGNGRCQGSSSTAPRSGSRSRRRSGSGWAGGARR